MLCWIFLTSTLPILNFVSSCCCYDYYYSDVDCFEEVASICAMLSAEHVWIQPSPPSAATTTTVGGTSSSATNQYGVKPGQQRQLESNSRIVMNFKNEYGRGAGGGGSYNNNSYSGKQQCNDAVLAEQAHAALRHPYGDFHSLLKVYQTWEAVDREAGSSSGSIRWCEQNFINHRSMKTAKQIRYHASVYNIC